jgi:hypothetical protein
MDRAASGSELGDGGLASTPLYTGTGGEQARPGASAPQARAWNPVPWLAGRQSFETRDSRRFQLVGGTARHTATTQSRFASRRSPVRSRYAPLSYLGHQVGARAPSKRARVNVSTTPFERPRKHPGHRTSAEESRAGGLTVGTPAASMRACRFRPSRSGASPGPRS